MTVKPRHIHLDELFDHIAIEEDEPSYAALSRWCELFPEHASELAEYFATWAEQIELPITQSVDAERFAAEAVSHALNLLHQEDSKQGTLTQIARSAGLNDADVAVRIGLDEPFVMKLFRRKIDFESIPQLCLDRLRDVLGITLAVVRHHLRGPPLATVANARMKSGKKAVRQTETFEEALASAAIDETQKAEWREALWAKGSHAEQ
ncbi:hypothetical protein [Sphingomonas sp.]|uniref:hypothetical protein n=1 Tax=Sphingomonas sp. TaxID=28214 RepID=UPI0038A04132